MAFNVDRRRFLQVLGAAGAGATLSACTGRGEETILSRNHQPDDMQPGVSVHFNTICRECPSGCGVTAETREGRVIKLEGNVDHPISQGTLCARGQAAPQGLYNPERNGTPMLRDTTGDLKETTWTSAISIVAEWLRQTDSSRVAWLTGEVSDSDEDLIALFNGEIGSREAVNLRLCPEEPLAAAARELFGYYGVPEFEIASASMVVSVGADFLETWGLPVKQIRDYTAMHAFREGNVGESVYVGSRMSNTASVSDEWVRIKPGREVAALRVICEAMLHGSHAADSAAAQGMLNAVSLSDARAALGESLESVMQVAERLVHAHAPLVLASGHGSDAQLAHSLALLATHLGGGSGVTVKYPTPARSPHGDLLADVMSLLRDVESGGVELLFVHTANPAFLIPEVQSALRSMSLKVVCFGTQRDETAARADVFFPIHHWLESWGDFQSTADTIGVVQPTMRPVPKEVNGQAVPFFNTRHFAEVLFDIASTAGEERIAPFSWISAQQYIESRIQIHQRVAGSAHTLTDFVRESKRSGKITIPTGETGVSLRSDARMPAATAAEDGLLALFFPHPYLYDGAGADKPLLQEIPETSTALTWGTWVEIHPTTAEELGLDKHDGVMLTGGGGSISAPIYITPQVMPGVVAVPIGQGHEKLGKWAAGRGDNPLKITDKSGAMFRLSGHAVTVERVAGGGRDLFPTTMTQDQGRRNLAQACSLAAAQNPEEHNLHADEVPATLYPEHAYPEHDWWMSVDLDACTGCGACVSACYMENNIPQVGDERLRAGREMSWIRIEKYVNGDDSRFLVHMCQQCHQAPCEPVCPVHAAYHTIEGLNGQVYNRCVGTRYCANNCTYKQRRFNWFDYTVEEPMNLLYNPDVTVRERGIMEKCTFCVQRIREAKEVAARDEGRPIRDGEIQPACAQTCPAKVINFGDRKNIEHSVNEDRYNPRGYFLLNDLGTRPSVTYLKKVLRTGEPSEGSDQHHG